MLDKVTKFKADFRGFWNFYRIHKFTIWAIFFFPPFLFLLYRLIVVPQIEKIKIEKIKLQRLYKKIEEKRALTLLYPDPAATLKALILHYKKLSFYTKRSNLLLTTQKLIEILEEEGIEIANFKNLGKVKSYKLKSGKAEKFGIELELVTDFISLGRFLEQLEKEAIFCTIDEISFGKREDKLVAYLKLGIFVLT